MVLGFESNIHPSEIPGFTLLMNVESRSYEKSESSHALLRWASMQTNMRASSTVANEYFSLSTTFVEFKMEDPVSINDLPNETLLQIFQFLSIIDLQRVSLVCKRFKFLSEQEAKCY